jgi:N-acetyl-gamma-glutamyl-phosphate reductase
MYNVAVVGASGYTGVELVRILANHPQVNLTCLTSRQHAGKAFSEVFPSVSGVVDLVCDPIDVDLINRKADVVFTALPHKTAMEVVPAFISAGKMVIDLSADYRLQDTSVYQQWYQEHTSPELIASAVYGLPELYRQQISTSKLVANPGCYPTSAALALLPLVEHGLIDTETIVIDSKSGTSGAGRAAKEGSLYCEVNESFRAYGVGSHRHTPEIEQTLSAVYQAPVTVSFTPHLLPVSRGILSTCYATLVKSQTTSDLLQLFNDRYAREPFVRIKPEGMVPDIAHVRGSNYCDIGVVSDSRSGRVVVVSVIDNLVKGASGQAVQNMNLMLGLEEGAGLNVVPLFP